jgi:hypothetical protein
MELYGITKPYFSVTKLYFFLVAFFFDFRSYDYINANSVAIVSMMVLVRIKVMVFIAAFNNISVISCRSGLLVEEYRVPRENRRPVPSH